MVSMFFSTQALGCDPANEVDGMSEYRMSNKVYPPSAAPEATREFRMMKFDGLVKSRKMTSPVIPAKAGIQVVIFFLDTRLRGCDGCDDSSDTP